MSDSRPLVIAFGHKARHGKGEAIAKIIEKFGDLFSFQRVSFADALRAEVLQEARSAFMNLHPGRPFDSTEAMRILCTRFGVPFDPEAPVEPAYPYGKQRKLYQVYGTEYRRAQDQNYWIKRAEETINKSTAQIIMIDDMRFPNEFFFVEDEMGGVTVKVNRVGFDNGCSDHVSEIALDGYPFKYVLDVPDGDLPELHRLAIETFEHIMDARTPTAEMFDEFPDPSTPPRTYTIEEAELDIALNAALRENNG